LVLDNINNLNIIALRKRTTIRSSMTKMAGKMIFCQFIL